MKVFSFLDILKEIWTNRIRMIRVARFDINIELRSFYLGTLWKIISPLIQLGIFWFVFGIGIRGGAPVDDIPFIVWMLAGFVPWIFISRGISMGANSIRKKSEILFKIKYPMSTVPVGSILICLSDFIVMFCIMAVIYLFNGFFPSLYWLNLIYYTIFIFVFLSSLALITSVIVQLAADFGNLISSLLQLLFFLTPILWQETNVPNWARPFFILNPIRYIVTGFRYSLLYKNNFFERPYLIAFFWGITFLMLIIGCFLQKKYASRFVDWI